MLFCRGRYWCFNAVFTRSDGPDRSGSPAGEDAMLIKHPRAEMAANAGKPASPAALQRAEAAAAELVGQPALERRRRILVGIGAILSIAWLGICALYIQNSVGW